MSKIDTPVPFIFGELFELVAYIGLNARIKEMKTQPSFSEKQDIDIYSGAETNVHSSLEANELNNFEEMFVHVYGKRLKLVTQWIKQLLLTKPINPNETLTSKYNHMSNLLLMCLEHNLSRRSNKNKDAPQREKDKYVETLLSANHITIIKLVNSAYNTGSFFVDWCAYRYRTNLDILIEASITDRHLSSNRSLQPDIIVKEKGTGKVLLVGDLKSYYPFLTSNYGEVLKDIVSQIPIYSTSKSIFMEANFKTKSLYPYKFRGRFNLLLRYFKLIRYMEWVLERMDDHNQINLDGVLLFPSKPILLNIKSDLELEKLRKQLKKLLNFNIREYTHSNGTKNAFDIRDKVPELEVYLENGNSYIDKNKKTGMYFLTNRTWIEETETYREHEVELCEIEKFDVSDKYIKAGAVSRPKRGQGNKIPQFREKHKEKFSANLKEMEGNVFSLLVNSSDQGIGKNYTISSFIAEKKHNREEISILFACPRKEPIRFTIEKMVEQLAKLGIQLNLNTEDLFGENWLYEDKDNKVRIGYVHNDKVLLEHYVTRAVFKKREQTKKGGSSAGQKLKEFLSFEKKKEWINIAFVTSDTLPSFIKTNTLNSKNLKNSTVYQKTRELFDFFDLFIFDELTNSSPNVRELFVDLLKLRPVIDKYDNEIQKKKIQFVVLDASITSVDLFREMIDDLFNLKGPYFIPFKELMQEAKDSTEENFLIETQSHPLKVLFYRQQVNYPLFYSVASIGGGDFGFEFKELFSVIEKDILSKTSLGKIDFESYLKRGEALFYVDNKAIVDELQSYLEKAGYPVSVVTADRKDKNHFKKNVVGTSALAFGTSYKDKQIMIILPPSTGVSFYGFKQQVELYRQVTKRMRGSEVEKERLIVFTTYPVVYEGTQEIRELVNIEFLRLRNYILQFITNRIYHQIPSFSSVLNSQNWIKEGYFNSLYHTILWPNPKNENNEDENIEDDEYLEIFLRDAFPRLKRIMKKWGLTLIENFEIAFESDKLIPRMPIPSYLSYHLNQELFARHFNITFYTLGKMTEMSSQEKPVEKIKEFIESNRGKEDSDLEFLYNLSRLEENNLQNKNKSEAVLNEIEMIIQKLENREDITSISDLNHQLCQEVRDFFNLRFLRTSGSSFLFSLELALSSELVVASKGSMFEKRRHEQVHYKNKLYATASPLKTLFYGAGTYYETPLTISFKDGNLTTYGFLCYYPKFKDYKPNSPYIRLLRYSLLSELFRENVIYLPNILADLET